MMAHQRGRDRRLRDICATKENRDRHSCRGAIRWGDYSAADLTLRRGARLRYHLLIEGSKQRSGRCNCRLFNILPEKPLRFRNIKLVDGEHVTSTQSLLARL
jgi:hypothetical protein